ncbi:MAG: hypothetical protein WDA20_04585 [Desulfuromonadales bacterium]
MLAAEQKPMYRFLAVQTAASVVGLQAWTTLFNNFAVEVAGLDGAQAGIVQLVRKVLGFLALLVALLGVAFALATPASAACWQPFWS